MSNTTAAVSGSGAASHAAAASAVPVTLRQRVAAVSAASVASPSTGDASGSQAHHQAGTASVSAPAPALPPDAAADADPPHPAPDENDDESGVSPEQPVALPLQGMLVPSLHGAGMLASAPLAGAALRRAAGSALGAAAHAASATVADRHGDVASTALAVSAGLHTGLAQQRAGLGRIVPAPGAETASPQPAQPHASRSVASLGGAPVSRTIAATADPASAPLATAAHSTVMASTPSLAPAGMPPMDTAAALRPAAEAVAVSAPVSAAETSVIAGLPSALPSNAGASATAAAGQSPADSLPAPRPQGTAFAHAAGAALPQADTSTRVTVQFAGYGAGHQVTAQWGGGIEGLRLRSSSEQSHRAVSAALDAGSLPGSDHAQVEVSRDASDQTGSRPRRWYRPDEETA